MKPYATLITFATGDIFERYADAMFASADGRFFPGRAQHLRLTMPYGGLYHIRDRHTYMLKHRRQIRGEFVFFLDADMLFVGQVGDEIVADGITATLHPEQNRTPTHAMTYERNPDSPAHIPEGEGGRYYVGAIIGGPRNTFLDLSREIDRMCQLDGDYIPIWQDESYLNRILLDNPPALELDDRYCAWWSRAIHDARICALDKTPDEFKWRNNQTRKEAVPA